MRVRDDVHKTCRSCGSPNTRARYTMWTKTGDKLRWRVCRDCLFRWGTIEVDLPADATPFMLDAQRKIRNYMAARERRGYHGPGLGGGAFKPEPAVDVKVRVRSA